MPSFDEIVTVVNRSSKPLEGTWDGKHYAIPPGESHFSRIQAIAFRYQNPIMGKGSPLEDWNIRSEYLIGIKEDGDPLDPVEQTDAPQRWDTGTLTGDYILVRPRGGMPEVRQRVNVSPVTERTFDIDKP